MTDPEILRLRGVVATMEKMQRIADDDWTKFANDIMQFTGDSWDGDMDHAWLAVEYVRHLELEVERLGGCRLRYCQWPEGEPCDHGYLAEAVPQ